MPRVEYRSIVIAIALDDTSNLKKKKKNAGIVNHNLFLFTGTWGNLGCVFPVWGLVSAFN